MVSPLTPIGFELPRQQVATTPTANLELPKVGTTGLAVLSQADATIARTLEAQSQSNQVQARATSDIVQAQAASGTAISQAAAMASQVASTSSQRTIQSLAQLGSTVGEITNRLAQERAAKLKAQQDAAKTAAIKELADAQIDWIEGGRIGREGTTGYRETISGIMGKYSLGADDVATLTERYYAPALDYAKSTESNRQKAAEDVAAQTRRIRVAGLQGKLSSALGGLAASAGLDESVVQSHYQTISGAIGEYMANEEIPLLDRLTGAATAYESTNEVMSKRNVDTSRIQADLNAFQKTAEYAVQLKERVLSGEMGITEFNNLVKLEAIKNGAPGFSIQDPNADNTYMTGVLSDQQKVRELQQAAEMDALGNVAASDAIIGSLTTEFALNPRALAAAKATDPRKLDKNAKAAIDLVEQFNKWRENDIPQYNRRKAALQSEMVSIDKDFRTWYINAYNRGQSGSSTPSEAKQLEQLRAGGITVEAVQRGLTPEQTAQVRSVTQDLLRSKQQEAAALDQEFSDQQQKFLGVGLSTDTKAMQDAKKQYEETRKQYTLKLQQIQATKLNSYQAQPGQSPNFRGGAPGNPQAGPLARRVYDGGTITMPFSPSVANAIPEPTSGMRFGDARPGRTHAGVDFAVPTGTPTTSMVYGRVTSINVNNPAGYGNQVEILGDDGHTYFYAHLSKVNVQPNQRVGPGQVVALTGASGGDYGPHLHMEISQGAPTNVVDPMQHLSKQFGAPARGVRTTAKGETPAAIDPRAIPLGRDTYLLNGKVIKATPTSLSATNANYSSSSPLRSSYSSSSKSSYTHDDTGASGYAIFKRDIPFRDAVARVAKNLNIPPQWLADVIAYESSGTFSTSITNPWGYTGLIQFGSAAAQDLGTTQAALARMSATQQMVYVEKYLRLQMRYAGVSQLEGPEYLVAAINQGHTVLRDVHKRGAAAVLDPSNQDGAGVTLKYYMQNLGKYSGRKYNFKGNRQDRLRASVIHERPYVACAMCSQLGQQTAFIPHESEPTA